MEVYEERFCESRDFGRKMWGADYVYYGLKCCMSWENKKKNNITGRSA